MTNINRGILILAVLLFSLQLVACDKKGAPPPETAQVSVTQAYEKYFGPAPTVEKGTCFAFVIYFPSAKEPGKVLPLPFFIFNEAGIKKVAVERLLGGMEVGSYKGETMQPFAAGTRLLSLSEESGTIIVNFSREVLAARLDEAGEKALLNALTLTLAQFPGVLKVRVQVEGKESGLVDGRDVAEFLGHGGLKKQPLVPDQTAIVPPLAPRLLGVTGTKEKGAKDVEDVSAFFDRPVTIRELRITDVEGKPFEGNLFRSVFDMAAVLKPKEPSRFQAGMPVRVHWMVVDKLGRTAQGDDQLALEVKEH